MFRLEPAAILSPGSDPVTRYNVNMMALAFGSRHFIEDLKSLPQGLARDIAVAVRAGMRAGG